jgi:para-nitrobenzyl esterase
VPLIIGGNAVEIPAGGSLDDLRKSMVRILGELAPRALALYGLGATGQPGAVDPLYGGVAEQWGSDLTRCPGIVEGEWHGSSGNPVWEYEFDRAIPPHPRVAHSGELPYVFGNLHSSGGNLAGDFKDDDRRLSATIQSYWTNFAKTGNPNGPGLPVWPHYEGKGRSYLDFTTEAEVILSSNERGPYADLFRDFLASVAASRP